MERTPDHVCFPGDQGKSEKVNTMTENEMKELKKIDNILYDYQRADLKQIEKFNGRALLALPMGSGKTPDHVCFPGDQGKSEKVNTMTENEMKELKKIDNILSEAEKHMAGNDLSSEEKLNKSFTAIVMASARLRALMKWS
jgi:hypothetical protein